MTRKASPWFVTAFIFILGAALSKGIPMYDFETFYYPSFRAVLEGESPYSIPGYYNAPWLAWALCPLGLLPYPVAKAIFFGVSLACFLMLPVWLGMPRWTWVLWPISPPVLLCLRQGNVDWLVLLGLLVPLWVCPWLCLIKPQVGLGTLVHRMIRAFSQPGWLEDRLDAVALPSLYTILAINLMQPTLDHLPEIVALWSNAALVGSSIGLAGILMGAVFLLMGWLLDEPAISGGAITLLSPYVAPYSWCSLWLAILVMLTTQKWREENRLEKSYYV